MAVNDLFNDEVPESRLPSSTSFEPSGGLPALPTNFPAGIVVTFAIGDRVRWIPLPSATDWGTIVGLLYDWAEPHHSWQPRYCVLLDADSPSREWTIADWAWQWDLEVFTPTLPSQSSTSTQEVQP